MSNTNIYVGNLNYQLDSDGLQRVFEAHGTVKSAKVVMDFETGRSKGFGFVEMESSDDAATAIQELDGTDVEGRTIKVNEAKPRNNTNRSYSPRY